VQRGIENYQAVVEEYVINNRTDSVATLEQTYRIAVKKIDDKIYTQIDFNGDLEVAPRSFISDGEEVIVFNPVNNQVEQRITIENNENPLAKMLGQETGLSRINLKMVREEASRLALNMIEDNNNLLLIELPSHLFESYEFENTISRKVSFDMNDETLTNVEIVKILEDGTKITTTSTPVYEKVNGVPVKIGTINIIDSQAIELVGELNEGVIIYDSPDDIPTLSERELKKMLQEGTINEAPDVLFGNPADLSYTETVIELYQDIEINNVSDSLYRLLLE
jgi:hypothetical protein